MCGRGLGFRLGLEMGRTISTPMIIHSMDVLAAAILNPLELGFALVDVGFKSLHLHVKANKSDIMDY